MTPLLPYRLVRFNGRFVAVACKPVDAASLPSVRSLDRYAAHPCGAGVRGFQKGNTCGSLKGTAKLAPASGGKARAKPPAPSRPAGDRLIRPTTSGRRAVLPPLPPEPLSLDALGQSIATKRAARKIKIAPRSPEHKAAVRAVANTLDARESLNRAIANEGKGSEAATRLEHGHNQLYRIAQQKLKDARRVDRGGTASRSATGGSPANRLPAPVTPPSSLSPPSQLPAPQPSVARPPVAARRLAAQSKLRDAWRKWGKEFHRSGGDKDLATRMQQRVRKAMDKIGEGYKRPKLQTLTPDETKRILGAARRTFGPLGSYDPRTGGTYTGD